MPTVLSNTFSVLISQAAAATWSKDNVPGSYDTSTDTWTPGRGSDGRVTAVSWNRVPLNRWVRVTSTRMDVLESAVKAAIPAWNDRGTSDWNGVLKAWSGMALDPARPRAFFFGGGHHDSANNGVYRFDLDKMAWAVQKLPTDPAQFDSRYTTAGTGSFTNYPPAADFEAANPTDYSVKSDCFYPFAPLEPTARHTYGSLVFNASRNELFMGCRRMWSLDLNTNTWSVSNQHAQQGSNNWSIGENMFCWWDPYRGKYIVNGTQNGNAGQNLEFDPVAKTTALSNVNIQAGDYYWATAKCLHDDTLYSYCRPDVVRSAELSILNIKTNQRSSLAVTGLASDTYSTSWYDGGGLTYIPELGKLLLASHSQSQNKLRLYWIDPATGVMSDAAMPGAFFANAHGLVETKMAYVKQLGAVVFVDSADNDIRILRVV